MDNLVTQENPGLLVHLVATVPMDLLARKDKTDASPSADLDTVDSAVSPDPLDPTETLERMAPLDQLDLRAQLEDPENQDPPALMENLDRKDQKESPVATPSTVIVLRTEPVVVAEPMAADMAVMEVAEAPRDTVDVFKTLLLSTYITVAYFKQ
uniref:TMV resistance protein N-like n=1 Tax=Steinernema glaseri TaxID=37863 RepID=A0A1I7XYQ5_9BILA